eukprot:CAMPEP_0201216600 /NCGR_PEP_ID=MMETSP0851-20130426/189607_1 /ASSEMBLY_ACC=CAM_ASM_000631 /TAXON_ID=183588 /ORGANISM="Pseudo-nitzschia fraudulenta, Strain WWA7" /LENGTH=31 /DNA_ID= /DNA_START= /DNA_END= /DNA_ORIENTATION=
MTNQLEAIDQSILCTFDAAVDQFFAFSENQK